MLRTGMGGLGSRGSLWLLGVFCAALTLRLIYFVGLKGSPFFDMPVRDALYHHNWAVQIASGDWIGRGVFFKAPLYPYFLAVIYKLSANSVKVARFVQLVIGSLSCVLIAVLAKRVFDWRVGLVAGLMASAYGMLMYFEGELLGEFLFIFLCLCTLLLLLKARSNPGRLLWLLSGGLLGFAALARPNVLLFGVFVLVWIGIGFRRERSRRVILGYVLAFVLGTALVILPVTARNYLVGRDFVLISSNAGVNFYLGNNRVSDGMTPLAPGIEATGLGLDEQSTQLAQTELGRKLKPSEVSNVCFGKGLEFWRQDSLGFLKLILRKLGLFWFGYEVSNNQHIYIHGGHSSLFRALVWRQFGIYFPFGILAPLALSGAVLSLKRRARGGTFLYGFVLVYMVSVISFFVCSRFRIPVVPILVVFAGFAAVWWFGKARAKEWKMLLSSLLLFGLLVFLLNHLLFRALANERFLYTTQWAASRSHQQLGDLYRSKGRFRAATVEYQKGLQFCPPEDSVVTYHKMADMFARQGVLGRAVTEYRRALEIDADYAEAHFDLATTYGKQGKLEEAVKEYEEALRCDPSMELAYHFAAMAYWMLGESDLAIKKLEECLRINPNNKQVREKLEQLRRER